MNFLKFIKYTFFFLTFLLGTQTTYSKTELILSQTQVYFSIELTQNFKSLEKEVQPNIGFLKEKTKFGKSNSSSAQINCNYTKWISYELANTVDELVRGVSKSTFKASFTASDEIAEQAWTLFKNEDWASLENLFNTNNLNKWDDIIYPPNDGFVSFTTEPLSVGTKIDRYGGYIDDATGEFKDGGKFFANDGEALTNRALPAGSENKIYSQYEVIQNVPDVKKGEAIPWFGENGKGIQYQVDEAVDDLIDAGFIKRVSARNGNGTLIPIGRGSTGRTIANNLNEKLAMEEVLSNPQLGQVLPMSPLSDPRWPGWRKMQYIKTLSDGTKINIHYVGHFDNGVLTAIDDFKFK